MEFNVWAAFVAGFIATVVMSALIMMAKAMGMTRMPAFELITGSMMSGDERTARMWGTMIHYIVMGTVVFGLIYAWLFTAFDSASWLTGLIIGIVHGIVVGMIMQMMPVMHPRMDRSPATVGAGQQAAVQETGEGVRISSPGMFGTNWGGMTPVGVLVGHAVYGVVLALVYNWLV